MSEATVEIRGDDRERSRMRAVRSLVGEDHGASRRVLVRVGDREVELPRALVETLSAAASVLEHGGTVAVIGEEAEVSPAHAARLLGVSRQYVDRLVADGVLPMRRMPGSSYRKIPVSAVLAYKEASDAKRAGIARVLEEGTAAGLAY